jgi:hypothetical protein
VQRPDVKQVSAGVGVAQTLLTQCWPASQSSSIEHA